MTLVCLLGGPMSGSSGWAILVLLVSHEVTTGVSEQTVLSDDCHGRQRADGLEYASAGAARFRIVDGNPLSATMRCERTCLVSRADWQTRVEVWSVRRSDLEASTCDAFEGSQRVFSRTWTFGVPRELV